MATSGPLLEVIDHVLLTIFVAELAARIIVPRLEFLPWGALDRVHFLVIARARPGDAITSTVLRGACAFCACCVDHLDPKAQACVAGLLSSLPHGLRILFLIGFIYYMFSVMGTSRSAPPPWLFGTLGMSL